MWPAVGCTDIGVMERARDAGVGGHRGRLDDSVLGGS